MSYLCNACSKINYLSGIILNELLTVSYVINIWYNNKVRFV